MPPRCWLPRRSWRLEHNQCHSLFYCSALFHLCIAITENGPGFFVVPGSSRITPANKPACRTPIVGGYRVRMILGAPGTPIPGFNQDAWVTSGHYDKRDPRKSVEQFRVLREANLALLKSLTPEQWKHHGIHSERGEETVEHIVRMFAGHDLNHIQQIERMLALRE